MKKILFTILISKFCFGQQSVTITPDDAGHLKIFQKNGTAQLTVEGDGDGENISHSNIQLNSFVPESSYSAKFAYNNIRFNDTFSIKHTKTVNNYGVYNRFGIYSGSNSIFEFDEGVNFVKTLALSLSSNTSNMLELINTNTLANGVENSFYLKTGANYTGAIKTIGKSPNEARMGLFTDAIGGQSQLKERLSILNNGQIGINTSTPQYQLSFKDDLGDKISLYYGNTSNTTNHYGLGIQAAKFQLFTPSDQDDLVFGYGRSAAFSENVRFKGTGLVGIGVNNPSEFLDVNGRMRVRHRPSNTAGVWMSNSLNSTAVGDGAFYGLRTDTEAGIFIGGAWRFGVTNTGVVSASGGISVGGGETIAKIRKTSVTYNIPSIPANSSILDTFTISDLSSTDNIIVNPDGVIFPLIIAYTRYIASTVMEIVFYNPTNVAVDIPSRSFNVTVIK